jgi:hypothetical protein
MLEFDDLLTDQQITDIKNAGFIVGSYDGVTAHRDTVILS